MVKISFINKNNFVYIKKYNNILDIVLFPIFKIIL